MEDAFKECIGSSVTKIEPLPNGNGDVDVKNRYSGLPENFTNSTLADTMRAVPSLKSAMDRRDTTQSSCTHACEARGAVWARGAVARGAVARGAVARRRSRGAQNVKVDGEWL